MSYPFKLNPYFKNRLMYNLLTFFYSFSIFFAINAGFALEIKKINPVETSYINGWQNSDSSIQGALAFYLKPGFLTYWRNPGNFGFKPHFDWSKSLNIKKITFDWPTPKIFNKFDSQIIGYEHELILPIKLEPTDDSIPMTLHLELSFGVCSDICIPIQKSILRIISNQFSKLNEDVVKEAISKIAVNRHTEKVVSNRCEITKDSDKFIVKTIIDFKNEIQNDTLIFPDYLSDDLTITDQTIIRNRNKLFLTLDLFNGNKEQILERSLIRIMIMEPDNGIEIIPCSQINFDTSSTKGAQKKD